MPRVSFGLVFVGFLFAHRWGQGKGEGHVLSLLMLIKDTDREPTGDMSKAQFSDPVLLEVPPAPCCWLQ